jgi:hypothetical protein
MNKKDKAELLTALRDADLEKSGLDDPKLIKKLGLTRVLGPDEVREKLGINNAAAYEIPYFDLDGRAIDYSRFKLFPTKGDLDFSYFQPEKTIPHIYAPPLAQWRKIAADASQRIVLTEGEKKAACGCLHGLDAIGLGGVWNWKAKKWDIDVLRDFDQFVWKGREVEVCFDGDLYTNENVSRALSALCEALSNRGARIYIRRLPPIDGVSKLDDFLVRHGDKGRDAYEQLEREEATDSAALWALNDDLVYVTEVKAFWSVRDRLWYDTASRLLLKYGSIRAGRVRAIERWVYDWPHRREARRQTYAPDQPQFTAAGDLNVWRQWGAEPASGDISVVKRIVSGFGDETFQRAFWQWLAYPIQNPGAKINWAVVLWSREHGTGKSYVADLMRDIYGDNAEVITSSDLYDERSTWLRHKQFIAAEEVTKSNDWRAADRLKVYITSDTVRINEKYEPAHSLPNVANLLLLSNHSDAVRIDSADRRYLVAEVHNDPRDARLWDEAHKFRKQGGAAHLMHYLRHEVDCSKFNPKGRAPMTDDKRAMIHESKSSLERWVADLIGDLDNQLGEELAKLVRGRDVFTVDELMNALPEELEKQHPTPAAFSKALVSEGAIRFGGGVLKTRNGDSRRLVALRNLEWWRQHVNDAEAWRANYSQEMTVASARRAKK